jgi:TonB family protein
MRTFSRVLLLCLLVGVFVVAAAGGQESAQDRPAASQASSTNKVALGFQAIVHELRINLSNGGAKKIIVLDFSGPDKSWSPFSAKLADQFSDAFKQEGFPWEVIDRSELAARLEAHQLSPKAMFDTAAAKDFARELGAEAFVWGSFGPADNGIGISLHCLLTADGVCTRPGPFPVIRGKIPFTPEVTAQLGSPPESMRPKDGLFTPTEGGILNPMCLYCPNAEFSREAQLKKVDGTVVLNAVIDERGRIKKVTVLTSPGYGLDTSATKKVKEWKFKPATDVDGNPVSVLQKIEVTFHLY